MVANAWISGTYWVGSDGVMAAVAWVGDGKYWADFEGKYVVNKKSEANTPSESDSDTAATVMAAYAASSNVYHINDCSSVQNIKDPPQTMTVAEAQAKDMTLCENCESMLQQSL